MPLAKVRAAHGVGDVARVAARRLLPRLLVLVCLLLGLGHRHARYRVAQHLLDRLNVVLLEPVVVELALGLIGVWVDPRVVHRGVTLEVLPQLSHTRVRVVKDVFEHALKVAVGSEVQREPLTCVVVAADVVHAPGRVLVCAKKQIGNQVVLAYGVARLTADHHALGAATRRLKEVTLLLQLVERVEVQRAVALPRVVHARAVHGARLSKVVHHLGHPRDGQVLLVETFRWLVKGLGDRKTAARVRRFDRIVGDAYAIGNRRLLVREHPLAQEGIAVLGGAQVDEAESLHAGLDNANVALGLRGLCGVDETVTVELQVVVGLRRRHLGHAHLRLTTDVPLHTPKDGGRHAHRVHGCRLHSRHVPAARLAHGLLLSKLELLAPRLCLALLPSKTIDQAMLALEHPVLIGEALLAVLPLLVFAWPPRIYGLIVFLLALLVPLLVGLVGKAEPR